MAAMAVESSGCPFVLAGDDKCWVIDVDTVPWKQPIRPRSARGRAGIVVGHVGLRETEHGPDVEFFESGVVDHQALEQSLVSPKSTPASEHATQPDDLETPASRR